MFLEPKLIFDSVRGTSLQTLPNPNPMLFDGFLLECELNLDTLLYIALAIWINHIYRPPNSFVPFEAL